MIHQHQAAKASDAGTAEHGEQAQFGDALVQTLDHFGVSKVVAFEETVHQSLVGLSNGLLQSIVELFDHGNLVSGDIDLHPLQILHLVSTLVQHVDDAGDLLGSIPNGDDNGSDLVAVFFPEGFEGGVIVGVVLVYLGDVDETGHIPRFAVFPGFLKADGDAVLGGADQNGCVSGAEGFHGSAGKVKAAGGIQQIDLGVVVFQGDHGGGDGNIAADLLRVKITYGVAVGVAADPVDGTGHVE